MTTNVLIITDALRLLGVLAETETPTAEQGEHALRVLNRMVESWTEDGVNLGWFEQSLTTATAPLPKWSEKGVVSKLAQDLQATYPSSSLQAWVMDDSLNGYGLILRKAIHESMVPQDMSSMPLGNGLFQQSSNILTDD